MNLRAMITDGRVHVFDGAMGTQLYDRGVFVNVCYDELSISQPELVRKIHGDYVESGAEILKTNTFGANPVKLSGFALDDRTEEINRAAARLAREVADGKAAVVGAIGPLGIRIEPWGPTSAAEAEAFFRRQAQALIEGGVDGFLLETFSDVTELHAALVAVRSVKSLPVFAQVTIEEGGATPYGTTVEAVATALDEWGADVIGVNCAVGPAETLEAIERMACATTRPLVAQPNAGLPRAVGDRKMYLASPAYMARYAKKIVEAGARFVGGCCGTTPEHIEKIAAAVAQLDSRVAASHRAREGATRSGGHGASSQPERPARKPVEARPLSERSTLGGKLARGEFVTSIELVPPSGWNPGPLLETAARASASGADVVTIVEPTRASRRMATIPAAVLLARESPAELAIRYNCRDRSMFRMISDLLGLAAAGVRNVIVVTGDPTRTGPYPDPTSVLDLDSVGLTNVIGRLNRGEDPGGGPVEPPTAFVIGVELDAGAADVGHEARRFAWKLQAGADFAITTPIFDAESVERLLVSLPRDRPVPILASVLPVASLREAEYLAQEVPGVRVPDHVLARMQVADGKGPEIAREEGIAIALEIVEALRPTIAGIQVSSLGHDVDLSVRLLDAVSRRFGASSHRRALPLGE